MDSSPENKSVQNESVQSASVQGQLRSAARTAINLTLFIAAALVLIYLLSGIYSVENNEVAVLQRFGKIIDANVQPGIHYALPWPIDQVNKVPFPKVEREDIADFSQHFTFGSDGLSFTQLTGLGTYAITGDNNLVNLQCVLQYEVRDPVAYLFNLGEGTAQAEKTARRFLIEMACNTLIHCFSGMDVDHALTGWEEIVTYVRRELQERLNSIDSGLVVTFVEIKQLTPPSRVQEYFDDVISAKMDKTRTIDDAFSYQKQEIPAARGRSARLRAEGEAYYSEAVNNAEGESQRFLKQLGEFRKKPELTRYRLYLDTIQEVLGGVEKYFVVDTSAGDPPARIKLLK